MTSTRPVPYKLAISENDVQALKSKLAATRFPDELEGVQWDYGVPLADMKRLVRYWQDGYDWRRHETHINETFPQFTIDIKVDGFGVLNIHHVHQRSKSEHAIPLLFSHGWPGHFMEAAKIIPLLINPPSGAPAFHVVAWSLPGFGFSDAPKKAGFNMAKMAEAGHKLMLALDYSEYVVQGGDWGSSISRQVARLYGGKHCKAVHVNMLSMAPIEPSKNPLLWLQHISTPFSEEEKRMVARTNMFRDKGLGYFHEQSSQPQTLSYGLADSPVGLLAWIYEKLHNWTDNYPFTDDEILDWISVYWFSKAGPGASLRIYYENLRTNPLENGRHEPIYSVPIGFSIFPQELVYVSKANRLLVGNLVYESSHSAGGHFAAFERPEDLVGDLREFHGIGGKAYGVVKGLTGYADD
ncbi:alpha/beta-hydrolase [Sistotremastrum suecicum HHB10207 ss-3]|uniref:Alpha/beta-hydrolase n=1 Tax=Sistotremastrum suecicum HHB10207 ss-3 TaxID=1314776 RepID=A0A166D3C6_9AGAM|nr:alpha/beta-hydrolase [Sistotremastrum suecicum HHB10207 ss-3]